MSDSWQLFPTENGVQTIACPSTLSFLALVDRMYRDAHGVIWRGQADEKWLLEPNLIRAVRRTCKCDGLVPGHLVTHPSARAFSSLHDTFRSMDREVASLDDDSTRAFAQHHGMFTELLDWSLSPYVAAFFGLADYVLNPGPEAGENIAVWGLSSNAMVENRMGAFEETEDPIYEFEHFGSAHYLNKRLYAQQGVFTRVRPPIPIEALVRYRRAETGDSDPWLVKVLIPKSIANNFLIHLNRMNVNYRSLFPDATGACLHANLNFMISNYEGRTGANENGDNG